MKVKKEDFKLKKFKKTQAGIQVGFQKEVTLKNGVKTVSNTTETYKDDPHPDLVSALEDFDEIVMYDEDYKKTSEVKVTGVTVFPEIESCIITHLKKTESGNTARNSGKISKESETYKLAMKAFDLIDILSDEVYQFVYEGKRAQLALFDPEEVDGSEEFPTDLPEKPVKSGKAKAMEVA